jgi:site-specific recombinase XerD
MARDHSPPPYSLQDEVESKVVHVWLESQRTHGTIGQYLQWVRRFRAYCHAFGLSEDEQLTRNGVEEFARRYCGPRLGRAAPRRTRGPAFKALFAWWYALRTVGRPVGEWSSHLTPTPLPPLIAAYVAYRRQHRGVAELTLVRDVSTAVQFLAVLRSRGRTAARARVEDVDWFVTSLARRNCRRTVAGTCSSLRAFLRYLQVTGRFRRALAELVVAPRVRRLDRPPRALPWADVRRILRAAHRAGPAAGRDYAVLLLMATYGLGAAETVSLHVEDIDWDAGVLRVRRPKTGVPIVLPLLPAVARAIVAYVRRGRPRHVLTRAIFVSPRLPHRRMSTSAVRHLVRKHARVAGVTAAVLGGHVLRHSYATRQVDSGVDLKVLGDILGHRRPESTSVYVRVALRRLRAVALPVPR